MTENNRYTLIDELVNVECDRILSLVADECKTIALSRNDKHATKKEYLNYFLEHCDKKYPIGKDLLYRMLYIPIEDHAYHIRREFKHTLLKHIIYVSDDVNIFWNIINEEVSKIKNIEMDKFKIQEKAINATLELIEMYHGEEEKIKLLNKLNRLAPELHINECQLFINGYLYPQERDS